MAIDLRGRSSVSFYDTFAEFPIIGSDIVLYVDRDTLTMYIWNGSTYEPFSGGGGGSTITVVANYSALPDPTTVSGQFYWCSASQGTYWLPGSLGGTYYNAGLYYSNGVSWEYTPTPYNASQAVVNTGTNDDQFITPKTFNDSAQLAGKVPYTGATADVNLGTFHLDAAKGTFTHNGSTDTLTANHTSGSGIGLSITKGGANEGLKVNKTSGSGNAATIIGTLEATTLVKTGGTSTQYLMADGSTNTLNQANILSLLGWFQSNRITESTAVTGTTAETIIDNTTIPANTYLSGGIMRIYNAKFRKVGGMGILTAIRIYIGPTANNLTGATLVATFSNISVGQVYAEMLRTFTCTTSGILGFSATQSTASDVINSSAARQSSTIDWTVAQNVMFTIQLGNASDSVTMIGNSIKNF
jgi:hypothetical protein